MASRRMRSLKGLRSDLEGAEVGGDEGLSVSEFNQEVKGLLEGRFDRVRIHGEISNLRRQGSGHVYFSLKDEDSQVSAVLFRGDALRNEGVQLRDGLQVMVEGSVSVYLPRGSYQVVVRRVTALGQGSLQEQFNRLRAKLTAEGLFSPERKRVLPAMPQRVGIITSPTGAVIRDFCSILQRLRWNGTVVVFPSRVQGVEAQAELLQALELANDPAYGLDLVVLARGGGSLEDLWNFNEEPLVRAVAASRLPVISAIGHETDFSLTDFAADFRAETPSAAAEKVVSGLVDYRQRASQLDRRLRLGWERRSEQNRLRVEALAARLVRVEPGRRVEELYQRLDELTERGDRAVGRRVEQLGERVHTLAERHRRASPTKRIQEEQARLAEKQQRLERLGERLLVQPRQQLESLARRLRQTGPESVLNRGFVMALDGEGEPVTRASQASPGSKLDLKWSDGSRPAVLGE